MTISDRVIRILADHALLDTSDVTMDDTLESLGLDSMGLVETIFAIEEAFDITVPFNANAPQDSAFDVSSVRSIVAAVEDLMKQQA
ncbi:acyl carrier protein [Loktanella sp. SALINAS62]|uniref:acyl carrier protein n=1 Tax=Loktanella sp. SALINAS62 TaxID=2706124 RepID=UPI001B8CC8AB|nr:acyl carrier protein [Loktanella sp. SALINAS62]MBS1303670.1 acyl carrier protein [Loktanella sp. SALINAS62]